MIMALNGVVHAKTSREARRKVDKESGIRKWGRWKRGEMIDMDARGLPYVKSSYQKVNRKNDTEILFMWEVKECDRVKSLLSR